MLLPQLLDVLPHTVKGAGIEFAAHERSLLDLRMDPIRQREHDRLGAELGFRVVVGVPPTLTGGSRLVLLV